MTIDEKLDFLVDFAINTKEKFEHIEQELEAMKGEMSSMKGEMSSMKGEISSIKGTLSQVETKVSSIELHLENVTDRNIKIIAENHINLSSKLDEAIRGAGKDVMTRIEVNVLTEKVAMLEKEVAELKNRIA